jgi:exopolysaccharide production protein ExoZ
MGMTIALLYKQYDVRLPAWLRICLIVLGAVAVAPGGTFPSGDRWIVWGLPAASIFAGVTLGKEVDFGRFTVPIKLLGDASYALYLIHPLVAAVIIMIFWMDGPFGMHGLRFYPMKGVLALGIVASIILSIAIFLVFERPATALTRHLTARRARSVSLP